MLAVNRNRLTTLHREEEMMQFSMIAVSEALGTTGKVCQKSPPRRTIFPPKGTSFPAMSLNKRSMASN